MRTSLILHIFLMLFAATDYSILTAPLGGNFLHGEYYRYFSFSGWGPGVHYTPDNSPLVVLTYLLGFGFGFMGFVGACRRGNRLMNAIGAILSVVGIISFSLEASHWLWEHNNAWMAYSPFLMILLAIISLWRLRTTTPSDFSTPVTQS